MINCKLGKTSGLKRSFMGGRKKSPQAIMQMAAQSRSHRWIYSAAQRQTNAVGLSARPVGINPLCVCRSVTLPFYFFYLSYLYAGLIAAPPRCCCHLLPCQSAAPLELCSAGSFTRESPLAGFPLRSPPAAAPSLRRNGAQVLHRRVS